MSETLTESIFSQTPALIPTAGWRSWECYAQRRLVLHMPQSCARQSRDSLEQLHGAVSVQVTACSRKEREDEGISALQFPALRPQRALRDHGPLQHMSRVHVFSFPVTSLSPSSTTMYVCMHKAQLVLL